MSRSQNFIFFNQPFKISIFLTLSKIVQAVEDLSQYEKFDT